MKSVLLPQTYLGRNLSEALTFCFDEVSLLRPPDIAREPMSGEGKLPEMFKSLEASGNGEDIGLEPGALKNMMHQWEAFIAGQRGDVDLEIIKAGVKPQQSDQETPRAIMHQIIGGAQTKKHPPKPPSASPGLVLELAHLMDKKVDEMRSLANSVDFQQEHMSESLGWNPEEEFPAEFQKITPSLMGSMKLEMEDESLISYRLHAWACMVPFEKIKKFTPLTLSPQAAVLLLDRANIFLGGKPVRSAAGAQSLLWPPVSLSMAGTTLAREALRLRLPFPEEAVGFKKALGMMLEALGQEALSSKLLKSLQEIGSDWLESGGLKRPGGRLGLMVFPGYSMAGLLNLMKGQATEPENPGASCPLWVLW